MLAWDVDLIVYEAGGVSALRDLLWDRFGTAPGQTTISMWLTRGSIPSQWLGAILYILMSENPRASMFKYLRPVND